MKNLLKKKQFGILMVVVLISVVLSLMSDVFLRSDNIIDVAKGNVVLGIMALGMLPVLISGGIDLSVSATIALCAVIAGKFMVRFGGNLFVIFLVCIVVGALIGFANGIIISKLKIPPIVTTLGTMSIVLGCVMLYTNGDWITNLPEWFKTYGSYKMFGLPIQILFLVLACVVTWIMLRYTLIGRGIYAIGGSKSSAMRVGYNIDKIQIFIYMFCGAMTGVASVVHTSIVQQVDPNAFNGVELNVISAVVIGGASTMGGSGTVLGTMLGVILMSILKNGLVLAKIPTFWQKIVMGLIIVFAVSIDVINRKREQNKLVRVDVEE
ncbi:ABC transporter permease [Oscillospiraceae bacterium PP1C4]